jgi:hypothetical protein
MHPKNRMAAFICFLVCFVVLLFCADVCFSSCIDSPKRLILSGLLPGGCEFLKSIHVVVIVYNPNIKSLL